MPFKKNILWWGVIIFFALVGALFYVTNSSRRQDDKQPDTSISPVPSTSSTSRPIAPKNPVNVIEKMEGETTVIYENELFTPREVVVKNETGCYVVIENKSNTDVTARLGPYNPKKEQGFLYAPVASQARMAIDPRYGTISRALFYNKNNTAAHFLVRIDATCL